MGTSGSAPDITREDLKTVFSGVDGPHTPLTTSEVAERLECTDQTAQHNLEALAERDQIQTREIDGRSRIWWWSGEEDERAGQGSELQEFGEFVRAVEDYAIFMLDPDGTVASWNEGAARIKGYAEADIVGEHFSTFYTEEDLAEGVPDANLEVASAEGRVEDEGWRVREDGSTFWANVVITAIRDDDGTLQGFTKVTRDMTEQREYEQELRQERDLVEQILETVPVSVYTIDSDGKFVRANQRALERTDGENADIRGDDIGTWDIYDAEGDPIPMEEWPWTQVVETGEPVLDYQCQSDLPGLGRRWLSINTAPVRDNPHDEERFVVSVEDITEQKEREQQLRRERDQTEKLLRTAPIAIAVQNAEGETVLANHRAQEALGLSEEQILSEPDDANAWDIYDTNGDPLEPDETPSARVLATGESVRDEEIRIDPPSGEQMQFHINAAPLFDSDGTIERVITAGEDITELKKRERQLERRKSELESELSEILDRISDAFYAIDEDWRFTHLNDRAAETIGQSRDELLGQKVWEVFPDAKDVYREKFRTAMETQEPDTFEVYDEDLDAWLEVNAYPSESGLSLYFRDITDRKEYQRKLEESNERLEQFAYAASHDLQEPLRMVTSYLQLIERRYGDALDEDGREFIEFAVDGADRMRDMIDGLLEYSRVETQGASLKSVDLDAVLSNVRDDLRIPIEESDATVTADSLPRVEGDPSQLRQVFQNLLDNAIEYSGDEPPRVHVSAERDGSYWRVSVRDEGIGIDTDDEDRIFEVFQRLHSNEDHPGTGIGLALCRRIVERHGGEIWVDSEPGEGATFSFTLPATGDADE